MKKQTINSFWKLVQTIILTSHKKVSTKIDMSAIFPNTFKTLAFFNRKIDLAEIKKSSSRMINTFFFQSKTPYWNLYFKNWTEIKTAILFHVRNRLQNVLRLALSSLYFMLFFEPSSYLWNLSPQFLHYCGGKLADCWVIFNLKFSLKWNNWLFVSFIRKYTHIQSFAKSAGKGIFSWLNFKNSFTIVHKYLYCKKTEMKEKKITIRKTCPSLNLCKKLQIEEEYHVWNIWVKNIEFKLR